jgi:hypothetical protein
MKVPPYLLPGVAISMAVLWGIGMFMIGDSSGSLRVKWEAVIIPSILFGIAMYFVLKRRIR